MRRLVIGAALLAASCGGHRAPPAASPVPATRTAEPPAAPARLTACASISRAECGSLRVPLDHAGKVPGTLDLPFAVSGPPSAPVVVFLSGGPGQPGLPFLAKERRHLAPEAARLRIVMLDQRGTGEAALRCPALQRQMGASDLAPPTRAAVVACAAAIGDRRRFFTTTDTVADIEALRQALGVGKIALDGVSYGSYVAERYALAHPDRVSRLVLDSIVPHAGVPMTSEVPMQAVPRVLGAATARDVATVVARDHDGPQVLDMLTSLSIGRPRFAFAQRALREAAGGNAKPLARLIAAVHRGDASFGATELSQGLHASTLCADTPAPWGDESAPLAGREAKLQAAAAAVDSGPFGAATASGNGIARQCLYWPPAPVAAPELAADLPDVPTLLLAGDKDLSTPLEWARAEAARAPGGRLIVVPGSGHSVQSQDRPLVERALAGFF